MSKGIQFPLFLYKGHENGTLEMVFHGKIYRYDSLLVNDMKELEAGEELGYIDSYHDAIFGIELDEPEPSEKKSFVEHFRDAMTETEVEVAPKGSDIKIDADLDSGEPDGEEDSVPVCETTEPDEESNLDKESEPEADEEF